MARWERLRIVGKRQFIWSHGVLRWGGFMMCFSLAVFQHARFGDVFSTEGQWWVRLILAAATWTWVGFLYGKSTWQRNEQAYREYQLATGAAFEP